MSPLPPAFSSLSDPTPASLTSQRTDSSPSPSPNPDLSAFTRIFSDPYIRRLIFKDIHPKSLAPIVRTCKLFLLGGSEALYRDFGYESYNKIIKRCEDKERLRLYFDAVRTVDLSHLTRTIQIAKWPSILSSFPNALSIKRYTDILYRRRNSTSSLHQVETQESSAQDEGVYQYTFSYQFAERLLPDINTMDPVGGRRVGIPKKCGKRSNGSR
ncbi:uncharacterized protein I303_106579 [Kwoniella dejecticola CBS 10117]|uniref:Uncharacterized protein n=1 Tax=Kwoniella dejecticola CBS 10117 TaxID=1296121 RepID=A0A1A5ZUA9_9TREE|nr:uncharacterized protein I303_08164 [Kwoniella dejecticola CBS 10117]OBR81394.1 hypothetical protein I303_08164 [Kwoniella dejecticola CBS 10117]